MSRLRVRVELNRGGVGVPLHKLSSVVQEAEKFFQMLAEDVRIDGNGGEWLAFDFENESLNFTAEFVGPVAPDQVKAFAAAFDGTTPLRRTTIAQFARITDAIGQDELIGFGLFSSDEQTEPSEWRCLSRRDAMRIAEEIQILLGASGELVEDTHLPAVIDHAMAARLFKERHDREALSLERLRLPELVRQVEANLSQRIARLEGEVDGHRQSLQELRDISSTTEESFRHLLTSVETFCTQATRQFERLAPLPQPAPQAAALPAPEQAVALPAVEPVTPPLPQPVVPAISVAIATPAPVALVEEPVSAASPELAPAPADAPASVASYARGWRAYAIAAVLIIGIVSTVVLMWSPKAADSVAAGSSPPPPISQPAKPPDTVAQISKPATNPPASHVSKAHAQGSTVMHVDIEAREPAWVSVTDASGKRLLAKTFEANETYSLELTAGATLRTGNAGGLVVRFNGKAVGPLGPTGKIRDISFKDGSYRVHAPDAG